MLKAHRLLWLIALVAIGACTGGDDDSFVTQPVADPTDPTMPTVDVTSLEVLTSNPQIPSDGALPVTITALIKDANNNFVEGQNVTFSANSGGITVTQAVTDAAGRATADLSAAGDPANRTITVTAAAAGLSDSVDVSVMGTQLTITGATSLVQGSTSTYTLILADAAGAGISGETVSVSSALGNTLSSTTLTTDPSGQAQMDYTAVNGGNDTLSVQGLGEVASASIAISADTFSFTTPAANTEIPLGAMQPVTVRWIQNNSPVVGQAVTFSTTRGTVLPPSVVTNASGEATVSISATNAGPASMSAAAANGPTATLPLEFVATTPASLEIQADPFTVAPSSQATITAVVRDVDDNLVKNTLLIFTLDDTTGGSLSVGSAVTDSQGRAQTFYTSSSTVSSVDGVTITAFVDVNPTISDSVSLTVAGREVFFTFGTGNSILEPNDAQYELPFVVQVTDADGRAVPAKDVSMSVVSSRFLKGYWQADTINDRWIAVVQDIPCVDEDFNRNGILDPGEDINMNGSIEAGNIATVEPGSFVTDDNGFGLVSLFYPQEYGIWLEVQMQARASVQGTEFSESQTFLLTVLAEDVNDLDQNPPGLLVVVDDLIDGVTGLPIPGFFTLVASPFGYNPDCTIDDY